MEKAENKKELSVELQKLADKFIVENFTSDHIDINVTDDSGNLVLYGRCNRTDFYELYADDVYEKENKVTFIGPNKERFFNKLIEDEYNKEYSFWSECYDPDDEDDVWDEDSMREDIKESIEAEYRGVLFLDEISEDYRFWAAESLFEDIDVDEFVLLGYYNDHYDVQKQIEENYDGKGNDRVTFTLIKKEYN